MANNQQQLYSYPFSFPTLSHPADEPGASISAPNSVPPQPQPSKLKKAADEEDAINCLEKLRASSTDLQVPSSLLGSSSNLAGIASLQLPNAALNSAQSTSSLNASSSGGGMGLSLPLASHSGSEMSPLPSNSSAVLMPPYSPRQEPHADYFHQPPAYLDHRPNFPCHKCTRICKTKSSLSTHLQRKHNDSRENPCPHCNKSYAIKDSLQKHINRKHAEVVSAAGLTTAKVFACAETDCKKSFPTAKELQDHMLRHSKEKSFLCGISGCTLAYTTKNSLNLHRARNHSTPKFQCGVCGERYAVRGDLNQHERRKHRMHGSDGVKGESDSPSGLVELLSSTTSAPQNSQLQNVPAVVSGTPALPGISIIAGGENPFSGVFSPQMPLDEGAYDVSVLPSSPNPIGLAHP